MFTVYLYAKQVFKTNGLSRFSIKNINNINKWAYAIQMTLLPQFVFCGAFVVLLKIVYFTGWF